MLNFPAAKLFVERAASSGAPIQLRDSDAPIVGNICGRLGGIALAIELAARARRRLWTLLSGIAAEDAELALTGTTAARAASAERNIAFLLLIDVVLSGRSQRGRAGSDQPPTQTANASRIWVELNQRPGRTVLNGDVWPSWKATPSLKQRSSPADFRQLFWR
jgi:hypothetical protein